MPRYRVEVRHDIRYEVDVVATDESHAEEYAVAGANCSNRQLERATVTAEVNKKYPD